MTTDAEFNLDTFQQLGEGEPVRLQKLAATFVTSAGKTLGELELTMAKGELGAVRPLAHKLKSSANWVGAVALGRLSESLEYLPADASLVMVQNMIDSIRQTFAATCVSIDEAQQTPASIR
jgi:HPt (histidine-containing phosphotransfer) domain-containing protein